MWINYHVYNYSGAADDDRFFSVPLTRKLEEAFESFKIFVRREGLELPLFSSELGIQIESITAEQVPCFNNPLAGMEHPMCDNCNDTKQVTAVSETGHVGPITCPECDPLTLARRIGATHRDGRNPNVFYKQERGQTLKAIYDDGDLTIWRYFSAHPPESAGRI